MGHCPFCKGAIPKDMLVYGGSCPHCLIEIPGEEAPTDPGEQALARQQEEQAAAQSPGRGRILAAAVALLLAGSGAGYFAWSASQEPARQAEAEDWSMISMDQHENQFEDDGATQGGADAAAAHSTASASSASSASTAARRPSTGGQLASNSTGSTSRASLNPGGSLSEQVAAQDPTKAEGPSIVAPPTGSTSRSSGMTGPSISIGSRSAQEVLSDPAEVEAMIKSVVSRNGRQLEDCYNDRLKIDETLQGRWSVNFVVTKSGKTSQISVKGLNSADAELESCIQTKIARWRFKPINEDVGMQRTYTFKP